MVAMTWGRSPPAAGSVPAARATLHAPTSPSSSFCGPGAEVQGRQRGVLIRGGLIAGAGLVLRAGRGSRSACTGRNVGSRSACTGRGVVGTGYAGRCPGGSSTDRSVTGGRTGGPAAAGSPAVTGGRAGSPAAAGSSGAGGRACGPAVTGGSGAGGGPLGGVRGRGGSGVAGAGVGGGVHDGQEVFELFGGREDLEVVQAVAPAADEGALELAQQLLGGLGAVLVQRVGPAAGDADEEVGVVLGGRAGQGVFHPGRGVRVAQGPDPLERGGDDARGPGRDLTGRDRGPELPVHGRHRPAGESLPGQQSLGEGEPAPGLRGADPQPGPQELRGVPVPVIQDRRRHG